MPIDTSIYQNIKPVDMGSPLDSAQKAMSLGQMSMQQQQMQLQMQQQMAMRQAYAHNVDENGNLNQHGVLSDLNRMGYAHLSPQVGEEFSKQNKAAAEAQAAQAEAANKTLTVTGPHFDYLALLPEEDRAAAYPKVIQQIKDQGIDVSKMDHNYDPQLFKQYYNNWQNSKPHLENLLMQADIGAKQAEARLAPVKLQGELYGSRSPNAELTSQYDKEISDIRGSAKAMKQMHDNYNHPSPQGDASLILNAFKIKFPNAPDVNSLKELSESQAASDQWKQMAHKALSGGLDQNTRDNLMRDGISTYRANYESAQDIRKRFNDRAKYQGVSDPTITKEPLLDETYKTAMALQDKIGPYVPPTERPGIIGGAKKLVSNLIGSGEEKAAQAAPTEDSDKTKKQPKYRAPGATVSADELAKYATQHKMKLEDAKAHLKGHGYVIGR